MQMDLCFRCWVAPAGGSIVQSCTSAGTSETPSNSSPNYQSQDAQGSVSTTIPEPPALLLLRRQKKPLGQFGQLSRGNRRAAHMARQKRPRQRRRLEDLVIVEDVLERPETLVAPFTKPCCAVYISSFELLQLSSFLAETPRKKKIMMTMLNTL